MFIQNHGLRRETRPMLHYSLKMFETSKNAQNIIHFYRFDWHLGDSVKLQWKERGGGKY